MMHPWLLRTLGAMISIFAAWPVCGADADIRATVEQSCYDCHQGKSAEGNFSIDQLTLDLNDEKAFQKWVQVYDRVEKGEMPPKDAEPVEPAKRNALLQTLSQSLKQADIERQKKFGRGPIRRLNRVQYENSLRDLLALPHLEVREMLPPDGSAHGFDTVGSALDLSYVQMSRYIEASALALEKAINLQPQPKMLDVHVIAKENGRLKQVVDRLEEAVPVGESVGLLRQPNTAQAPWSWSKVDPPADGNYRIRMKTFGFVWDKGKVLPADRPHAVTFQVVQQTNKRNLGTFDIGPSEDQATIHDFTAYLKQGDQLQIWFETLDDRNKGKTPLEEYTAPGVAVEWLEIEGPIHKTWPPESYHRLFADLPIEKWTPESGKIEPPLPMEVRGVGNRAERVPAKRNRTEFNQVVSENPPADARRLLLSFAERAFRRPAELEEIAPMETLVLEKLEQGHCFQEAMRIGYQAILCAPEFLFLEEQPGKLDQYALAARLSYFLWKSTPDEELYGLARQRKLSEPKVLDQQIERMLSDPKSQRFVEDFCGQWLDLRRISATQPDEKLYPESDPLLLDSMLRETHAYFREMLDSDLSVDHLVDSDFIMVNGRLARHYGIAGVEGVDIRKVSVPEDSPRGGLLTMASILKVTANGTSTSPVVRGAWVLDRICGQPVPLPPANVPAIEPDLRGATTIREQLDKHRSDASCAVCHRRMDPPGFALENFDVIGGWRQRYRSLEVGDKSDNKNRYGHPVNYKLGLQVDASGEAPDGSHFDDIDGLRQILLRQRKQLARSLVEKLVVYSTGAGIGFADRDSVESILDQASKREYGLRSMIHAIVQSDLFQTK
ncbi:DUF1592 domain-containing protein [bacterium]|nr:DUF1592 domain-containing protein [bacterium]